MTLNPRFEVEEVSEIDEIIGKARDPSRTHFTNYLHFFSFEHMYPISKKGSGFFFSIIASLDFDLVS